MHLGFAGATDRGRARARNEDRFVADGDLRFFAVVDGMGGHACGDIAALTVAQEITAGIRAHASDDVEARTERHSPTCLSALAIRLERAILGANQTLAMRAQANAARDVGGATLAAALFGQDEVAIAHVGDCRAYLLRNGTLSQMTRDHSFVAEQVARGVIDADAARTHPLRHVVTRAVSGRPRVAVDILEVAIRPGDRLLLCSDGIHGVLTDIEIASLLGDRQRPLDRLCAAAIDAVNARGGPDNATAVVIQAD